MNLAKEIAALERMAMQDLRDKYADLFGECTTASNKQWLIKRLAWRLQSQAQGGLSERARQRAAELANDGDLRMTPPRPKATAERTVVATLPIYGNRLPPPGSIITRAYKGQMVQVKVLKDGFEFEGETYKSLSAVAKHITGQHCNGFLFFKLAGKEASR